MSDLKISAYKKKKSLLSILKNNKLSKDLKERHNITNCKFSLKKK